MILNINGNDMYIYIYYIYYIYIIYIYMLYVCIHIHIVDIVVEMIILHEVEIPQFSSTHARDMPD